MNRGRGRDRGNYSSSTSNRGSNSWRNLHDSPVQTGASFHEQQIAGSSDRESKHSWQVKQHNSTVVVLENNNNVTPDSRHHQAQFGSNPGQHMSDRKQYSSWQHVRGHNSDGAFSGINERMTSAGYQGEKRGQRKFRGEHSFRGGREKQYSSSSKFSSTYDFNLDNQIGSLRIETKVDIKLNHSFVESVNHPSSMSRQSSSDSGVEVVKGIGNTQDSKNNEHVDCSSPIEGFESVIHPSSMSRQSPSDSGVEVVKGTGNTQDSKNNEHVDYSSLIEIFDICPPKSNSVFTLKPSLLAKNKEKRNELKNSIAGPKGNILRSGMVLLKSYLSSSEQASILKICRMHGLGPAGFYQPRFREGAKMHLKMMCFGEFWDPETSKYGDVRPIDHAKPSPIPPEFLVLVDRAMKDSQSLIAKSSGVKDTEKVLPSVEPDICIVNYYATTGRLGLHQDKDESRESLNKGIPIVSFSIGDTAEFLYGDERDADKADKVMLESGDVLIFGGKARHIFHGVSTIKNETAPKSLLEETNFRAGRLNLTFRQHF